ncbi:hypothetical protein HPP92_010274 [Vanilla planifolia]|uniref:Uncharacterized protein n=1 Tax=Vanilla planifolia TaxID=51239 RepID=A0A835R650_VANPL|nr:hypothetical protein HPP92_010274 [Vanilla planifolia]
MMPQSYKTLNELSYVLILLAKHQTCVTVILDPSHMTLVLVASIWTSPFIISNLKYTKVDNSNSYFFRFSFIWFYFGKVQNLLHLLLVLAIVFDVGQELDHQCRVVEHH